MYLTSHVRVVPARTSYFSLEGLMYGSRDSIETLDLCAPSDVSSQDGTYSDAVWAFTETPAKLGGTVVGPGVQTVAYNNAPDEILATFSDPANRGGYKATMDWGDGHSQNLTVQPYSISGEWQYDSSGNLLYTVMGHHGYQYAGSYNGFLDITRTAGDDENLDAVHIAVPVAASTMTASTYDMSAMAARLGGAAAKTSATWVTATPAGNANIAARIKDAQGAWTNGAGYKWVENKGTWAGIAGFNIGTAAGNTDAAGWCDTGITWGAGAKGTTIIELQDGKGNLIASVLIHVK